jgi:cbb3-type cytochrome oxidase maturation protein
MESVFLLIPLSIVLLGVAVWAFFWAVNEGQFEELDEPSRIVLEDDPPAPTQERLEESRPRDANRNAG